MSSEIPVILCHERQNFPGGMEFFCPYCSRLHLHGRGDGHRVAHCDDRAIKRWSNAEVQINSPYQKTGYKLVLAYPYDPAKEKIYSVKPKITIRTHRIWSYIVLDLDNVYSNFTEEGKAKLKDFFKQFDATSFHKAWYKEWTYGPSLIATHVRKEIRFHVAQGLLNIATDASYIKRLAEKRRTKKFV